MPDGSRSKTEFGDFQTPKKLARKICDLLVRLGLSPASIVEPTCGAGSFLQASASAFLECELLLGYDINPRHVESARAACPRAVIGCEDFFSKNWSDTLDGLTEPILIVGNPPWVTNSTIGAINGTNLPPKSNSQRFNGLDAITGRSNFDISEWMLTHLLERLSGRTAVLAMLCKTVVARKVLRRAWSQKLHIDRSAIYAIDALDNFGAAVDACLLVCILEPGGVSKECQVFDSLEALEADSCFAMFNDRLVADSRAHRAYGHLCGPSPIRWRSGIKHDCSRIMELMPAQQPGRYVNKLGEVVDLETVFLFPMLKSSELTKGQTPSRYMLVTQKSIGDDTSGIADVAPRTWRYLQSHADILDSRSNSIYRNRPRFSIFGVGEYSFAPWKVAISGFYKSLSSPWINPCCGTLAKGLNCGVH